MLNHFRSLSLEATVLENNNHSLESEAAEVRGALQTARHQILDLERQLADRDSLIKGYETQVIPLVLSCKRCKRTWRGEAGWEFVLFDDIPPELIQFPEYQDRRFFIKFRGVKTRDPRTDVHRSAI